MKDQTKESLLKIIGNPPPGSHPEDWNPRGATWHAERLNWMAEIKSLRDASKKRDEIPRSAESLITNLAHRFAAWPLPESMCSDTCVSNRGAPHRTGTNLLTVEEAEQMIRHLIGPLLDRDASTEEEGECYMRGFFDGAEHVKAEGGQSVFSNATFPLREEYQLMETDDAELQAMHLCTAVFDRHLSENPIARARIVKYLIARDQRPGDQNA